ncbi:MAG: DUF1638 domain-containing protein [Xanthomonadales bacterium]|jgi:hypothetical protein|nr:DUF1638 domain-containing protein [Xanthomonadales bacterium]
MSSGSMAVICCGAIARELVRICRLNNWSHVDIHCLPAGLHNTPERIPFEVHRKAIELKDRYPSLFVAYAECGTGGKLDEVLTGLGIERLPGAHCYQFIAGSEKFRQLADAEPGSFYATDFLVRHFERLVVRGLGLEKNPELVDFYFKRYHRFVYLAQSGSERLQSSANAYARRLGLEYHYEYCGDGPLSRALQPVLAGRTRLAVE